MIGSDENLNENKNDLFTLLDTLSLAGDVKQAEGMSAYMRDQFEFLGIKTPQAPATLP